MIYQFAENILGKWNDNIRMFKRGNKQQQALIQLHIVYNRK